jgi:hypothetical protein
MSKRKKSLPTSKAKTAYGLLSEIRALILAEPKRYNQHDVLDYVEPDEADAPACGTVGCVAGWTCVLKVRRLKAKWLEAEISVLDQAQEILGLSDGQAGLLFEGHIAGERCGEIEAHADRGAAFIAAFQKRFARQLKAKAV